LCIEKPSERALGADSLTPQSASNIGSSCCILLYAFAVYDNVAFVALLTDSLLRIELLAGTLYFAANSIFIEEEPF
jgi:hypothetical protein